MILASRGPGWLGAQFVDPPPPPQYPTILRIVTFLRIVTHGPLRGMQVRGSPDKCVFLGGGLGEGNVFVHRNTFPPAHGAPNDWRDMAIIFAYDTS